MIPNLKSYSKHVLAYLGDAAHRRFIATIIAFAAAHFLGKALDETSVANALEVLIVGFGGAWSSTTPAVEPDDADEAGA